MFSTTFPGLTSEELQQADKDGFYVAHGLFSPAEVEEIKQTFMSAAANGPVEGLSEISRENKTYSTSDPLHYYPRMIHPHRHPDMPVGQIARKYMLDGRLYPILRDLFNDEPVCVQSMFYFKPPGARGQSLHQDNFYLRVSPFTCMAAWIAIDDAEAENGGMVVVPGSNHLEIACPEKADNSKFFTSEHVPVPPGMREEQTKLKAGDVLFFNGSLIHGSYPNASKDRFRRSFICHYVPRSATELHSWYQPTTFDGGVVHFAESTGGGPCGTMEPSMTAPH